MGAAFAARLMEVGHEVTVWNRSAGKTKPLADAGAEVAKTPSELASAVEAIVTILTNSEAMREVYEGPSGLLAGEVKGKLVVEMSTVQPHDEMALAEKVRANGATFVECPVGGTVGPARQGKLLGVAGCAKEDFARAKPLLEQMCRRVEHVGPIGAGASMKLALNLPLMVYYQALGEALVLCRHLGLDNAWLMEFLSDTSGAPAVLKTRGAVIATALDGKDTGPRISLSTLSARTCAPCWRKLRSEVASCRWWRKRWPSTTRPPRTVGVPATASGCRPIGARGRTANSIGFKSDFRGRRRQGRRAAARAPRPRFIVAGSGGVAM
jgi:3-hydroxyisobutyrate dehydrogenase